MPLGAYFRMQFRNRFIVTTVFFRKGFVFNKFLYLLFLFCTFNSNFILYLVVLDSDSCRAVRLFETAHSQAELKSVLKLSTSYFGCLQQLLRRLLPTDWEVGVE